MFKIARLDLLISLYIFCLCVAELMGGKTFPLVRIGNFPLNASVAIFVLPIIFTINDVITEVYGKERTRSIIRSGLFVIVLLLLTSLAFTSLPPSPRFASHEGAYDQIFGVSARIAASSLVAFTLAEFLDVFIFSYLRKRLQDKALWLRNNLSNWIAQLIDTVVFMTLAFYAFDKSFADNWGFLLSLIIPYWLLKCFVSVIETPFVYLGVRWLRKEKEGVV